MPTKKQQRRRQKQQRHEWEEVYVDETGRELQPEEAEELVGAAQPAKKTSSGSGSRAQRRSGRTIDPPSWRKTGKRALLFFPLMLAVVFLLSPELTVVQKVFNTVVLMGFFVPFSYFMDTMMWRSAQRRLTRTDEKKS